MSASPPRPTERPTQRPEWRALAEHRRALGEPDLRRLFAAEPDRGERLSVESGPEPDLTHDGSTNALIRRYRRLRAR